MVDVTVNFNRHGELSAQSPHVARKRGELYVSGSLDFADLRLTSSPSLSNFGLIQSSCAT